MSAAEWVAGQIEHLRQRAVNADMQARLVASEAARRAADAEQYRRDADDLERLLERAA